jgi:GWxTD domain-containing protein
MSEVWRLVLAILSVVSAPAGAQQARTDEGILVYAMRSYRPEHRTDVDAFLQVPYSWLRPSSDTNPRLSYKVTVQVQDSTGLTLLKNAWQNHAPAPVREANASGLDIFHFSVAPGHYRLSVEVQDSITGQTASSATNLEGFSSAPTASDLLLSPEIRPVGPTDSMPQPSELRWGRMMVTAAAQLELTPLRPHAYYLLEAYSQQPARGSLALVVEDSAGTAVVRTPPARVQVEAGGGVLRGQVNLTGLPPGQYRMKAMLRLGPDSTERSASFVMRDVGETLAKDAAQRAAARIGDEGYFAAMNNDALIAAEEPLATIAESQELDGWDKSLSLNGKRNLLSRFWARRDPTPGTMRNEARESFYAKVENANRVYGESGRRTSPGWRSDRGRIYLRYGAPDEVLRQGAHGAGGRLQSRALPYEVWRYTSSGKDRYYIFVDRTGVGSFSLVRSNDLKESGLPNWNEFFGKEDFEEIGRFLGRDVFR